MSMSQEEIEALMNGLEPPKNDNTPTEKVVKENKTDEIHKSQATDVNEEKSATVKENISEVLSQIDNMQEDDIISVDEDILSQDDLKEENNIKIEEDLEFMEKAKNWTEDKIIRGEFPFPAEPSTKVVSQLNEVANDSEEKAGQIFDVLSFILDDNAALQKNNRNIEVFIEKETELLSALSSKFPNIKLFKERLEEAHIAKEKNIDTRNRLNEEDVKLFEAMELMQFNDINRQKIERVMAVIRKLTTYLNNLFEEDDDYEEISVAKHIHGDSNPNLVGAEDLEALIAEFNK